MNNRTAQFLPLNTDEETVYSINDETPQEETAAEKAAQASIEQLSSNAEKGKVIRIYRQTGSGQESMEFVCLYPADKYSIDELIHKMQTEYGGGDYRFMIYNEKGKIAANKLISIAKKQTAPEAGENAGMYSLLQTVMQKQDEFARFIMGKQNEPNNSRTEMLNEMLVMKQLFSSENSGGNSISQIKELMEAMNLIKEMNPAQEDNDSGFAGLFKESLPLLQTIASGANQTPVINPAPNPSRRNPQMNIQTIAIKQLLAMKKQDKNPQEVAESINAQLPDNYIPAIEKLILGDDALDRIAVINPDVMKHGEWFADVIEWLKGYLGYPCKFDSEFDDDLTGAEDGNNIPPNESSEIKSNGNPER